MTSIGNGAFYGCSKLTSIEIPIGVTAINSGTFYNCSNLTSISIPNSVTSIGNSAFSGCSKLTSIEIPTKLTSIGEEAFYRTGIPALVLPACVTSIGYNAFPASMSRLTCESSTPPELLRSGLGTSYSLSNIYMVLVPEGCSEYYKNVSPWSDKVIVDGQGVIVTVNVSSPGMMGEEILTQTDYLNDVNHLTVSGALNNDDIEHIRNSMPYLLTIDMSGVDMTTLPNNMFNDHKALLNIILPDKLESISYGAFYGCINLESIVLPEGLKRIEGGGPGTFQSCQSLRSVSFPSTLEYIGPDTFRGCRLLNDVALPEGLTSIAHGTFESCTSLEKFVLPKGIQRVEYGAFGSCTSLKEVEFNEGLEELGYHAFYYCSNLTKVTLPSTLESCGNELFAGCKNLTKVTSLALLPPALEDRLFSTDDMATSLKRTLYAPEWTLSKYKLTSGWNVFSEILPLGSVPPTSINVSGNTTLSLPNEGLPAEYKPDMNIKAGYLDLRGNDTLSLNTFKMTYDCKNGTSAFLTEPTVVAESVITELSLSSGNWHFLSFPYDVKVKDIATGSDWVIRYYDGAARAKADYNHTWVTVPYDSMLHAGQGYIWSSNQGDFMVPAMDNANKNLIFANDTRYIPLTEHASEQTSNNSWNLIGNPFPCYYDTRFMEYTAPITVWDRENRTYVAYSPIDDNYILSPLEAFFVQRPAEVKEVGFRPDGRQTSTAIRTLPVAATVSARALKTPRQVFNMQLTDGQRTDRTRIVINADACTTYEVGKDAAKFMSSDITAPQLFTLAGSDKMAINERPFADGRMPLGVHIGIAGTYTLSLEAVTDMDITLIDHMTGKEQDLNSDGYTFETETGTFADRFTVVLTRTDITVVDKNVAEEQVKVFATGSTITVAGAGDATIVLYTASGIKVVETVGPVASLNVQPGLYVVKVGNTSYKVSVSK